MTGATKLLPCRHVMVIRKRLGLQPLIPLTAIHQRWRLRNMIFEREYEPPQKSFEVKVQAQKKTSLSATDKFTLVKKLCVDLQEVLPMHGTSVFKQLLECLKTFKTFAVKGIVSRLRS